MTQKWFNIYRNTVCQAEQNNSGWFSKYRPKVPNSFDRFLLFLKSILVTSQVTTQRCRYFNFESQRVSHSLLSSSNIHITCLWKTCNEVHKNQIQLVLPFQGKIRISISTCLPWFKISSPNVYSTDEYSTYYFTKKQFRAFGKWATYIIYADILKQYEILTLIKHLCKK